MDERTVFQSAPPGSVKPGVRLNGIYEIESLIAKGGMGEVYKGFNILTGDPVAIKMILPDLARNEDAFSLFKREASTLHNLQHEAIVRYYVFSRDPELDRAYLAMEFVDGVSLAKRLASGAMPVAEVRLLQTRIAGALEAAHQLGVVHRDISSDNIILPGGDVRRAKVIDFGIAKSLKPGDGTIIGDGFAGKYKYVSPEQLGLVGGVVGPKSDIYSLGLVLVEALRGAPLDMGGSQAEVIDKRRVVPDLADVPVTMRPLLHAMLQPRPEDRPASMAAIAQWSPTQTSASSSESRAPKGPRAADGAASGGSGGAIAAILGGLILLGGVGAAGYFLRGDIAALIAPGAAPSARPTLAPSPSPGPTSAKLPPLPTPSASSVETPTPTETGAVATSAVEPTLPPATPTPSQIVVAHVPTGEELADQLPPSPEAASVALPRGAVGKPYRAATPTFADPGGKGLTLQLEPAPPPGLALKDLGGGHGEIAGTPTKAASGEFSIIAKNHNGRTGQTLAMIVIDDLAGETPKPGPAPTPHPSPSLAPTPAPPTLAATTKPLPTPVASILSTSSPRPVASAAPTLAPNPPPSVAATPESPSTGSKEAALASVGAKAAAFAAAFDGGPCFMIRPRGAPEQLEFQGVGVDVAPFQRFDSEFTKTVGADAKIGLRMIAPQQCPAVALLKSDPVGAGDPHLDLASLDISAGKSLAGEIRNLAGRTLTLLIVTNDGASVKIDAARQPGDDHATFSVPLTPDAKSVKTLQMLLAIVSSKPLKALEGFKAGSTADIIPKVEAEFGPANANVAAEFFRVGN